MIRLCLIYLLFVQCQELFSSQNERADSSSLTVSAFLPPGSEIFQLRDQLQSGKLANNPSKQAGLNFRLGRLYYFYGYYQESLEHFFLAEDYYETHQDILNLIQVNNALGEVYYKINGPEASLQFHQRALDLTREINAPQAESRSLSFVGGMYEKLKQYEWALSKQYEALTISSRIADLEGLSMIRESLGSIFEDLEQYDSALFYFQEAYQLNSELENMKALPGNLNNIGDIYRKTGDLGKALEYTSQALENSRLSKDRYQERSALVDLGKAYSEMGDFENAYQHVALSRKLSEAIFSDESARYLAIQEAQFELGKKERQIISLEQRQKIDSYFRWFLGFLVLFLVLVAALIFNRQKLKIKTNNLLLEKKEELLNIRQELWQKEKENRELLEQKIRDEDEAHGKYLVAQTLHVINKNQMLQEIQAKLKGALEEDVKTQKSKIRNLIKQIDYNFQKDSDWEDFKVGFEKVHQDFLKKLKKQNPDLTSGDLKLACLMKMNLSSRETATTLGITMESLRISRYRLRKRLHLKEGNDLRQYLWCL